MRVAELISDPTFKVQVGAAAEEARKRCDFARGRRNQRLAHTDLTSFRNGHASTLPDVTSKHIEDALESLRSFLKSVEEHYGLTDSIQKDDPFGAKSLVHYLEEATRAMENGT
jgi:hypothetical protein